MEAVVILFASRTYSEIDSMRIPKSLLYGELVFDKRNRSRRKLRFKEVCKRSLKILNIRTDDSELLASYRYQLENVFTQKTEGKRKRIL